MSEVEQVQDKKDQERAAQALQLVLKEPILQEALLARLETSNAQALNFAIVTDESIKVNTDGLAIHFAYLKGQQTILEELLAGGKHV